MAKENPNKLITSIKNAMFDELVQLEVQQGKRELGIDEDIIVISNSELWKSYFGNKDKELQRVQAISNYQCYIYLNEHYVNSLKKIKENIRHELLHVKHPNWSEKRIERETKRWVH